MEEIIKASNVTFSYPEEENVPAQLVLDDISLNIKKGEFVAILGHNGSGKSTLAKHFNAILNPVSGSVTVEGMDTADENNLFDIRSKVGMVFQNPDNQIVATVVEEDVAFAPENLGVPPEQIRERVDSALKTVGMFEFRRHAPHQLSGGQKQRVAIAGVIAMSPDCIVLDEPTAMLDPQGRAEVIKTIKRLNSECSTTIVLITHYMDEAVNAERVVVVDNGRILTQGSPREVFSQVELLKGCGLDVPQVTELAKELKAEGIDMPEDILNEREFVLSFMKVLEEKSCQQ